MVLNSPISLVILKLDLELIVTESQFAPNNYLSDPNQHIKVIQNLPGGKTLIYRNIFN